MISSDSFIMKRALLIRVRVFTRVCVGNKKGNDSKKTRNHNTISKSSFKTFKYDATHKYSIPPFSPFKIRKGFLLRAYPSGSCEGMCVFRCCIVFFSTFKKGIKIVPWYDPPVVYPPRKILMPHLRYFPPPLFSPPP